MLLKLVKSVRPILLNLFQVCILGLNKFTNIFFKCTKITPLAFIIGSLNFFKLKYETVVKASYLNEGFKFEEKPFQ